MRIGVLEQLKDNLDSWLSDLKMKIKRKIEYTSCLEMIPQEQSFFLSFQQ